jgi:hypothetical protein
MFPLAMPATAVMVRNAVATAQTGPTGAHSAAAAIVRCVGVEVAGGDAGVRVQHAHAEHGAAGADIVVPLRGAGREQLGMDAEGIEVERGALRRLLLEALVVDVIGEEQRRRPLGDR